MFNYFNNSLWTQIGGESKDFWEELKHFKEVNQNVGQFCEPIYKTIKAQPASLQTLFHYKTALSRYEFTTKFKISWNRQIITIDNKLQVPVVSKFNFTKKKLPNKLIIFARSVYFGWCMLKVTHNYHPKYLINLVVSLPGKIEFR